MTIICIEFQKDRKVLSKFLLWLKRLLFGSYQKKIDAMLGEEGGLIKRIDEHRELVEFLLQECPEAIEKHEEVRNWAVRQDVFLCGLLELSDRYRGGPYRRIRPFPLKGVCRSQLQALALIESHPGWMYGEFLLPSRYSSSERSLSDVIRSYQQGRKGRFLFLNSPWKKASEVFSREGGLTKRIDEHRKVTEFLADRYLEVLERNDWVKDWLIRQDKFLCGFLSVVRDCKGWSQEAVREFPLEKLYKNNPRRIKGIVRSDLDWECGTIVMDLLKVCRLQK